MIILTDGLDIDPVDALALSNDLVDIEGWVKAAVSGKAYASRQRLLREWSTRLFNDDSVASIPANEDAIIRLITSRADYRTRLEREELG